MDQLRIDHREVNGVSIIDLDGKITIGRTNRELHESVRRLARGGGKHVILNLAKVNVIDSSGLGEVVACFKTMQQNDGVLRLVNLSQRITDLMTITKLYTVFDIFESEEKGLKCFADEAAAAAA